MGRFDRSNALPDKPLVVEEAAPGLYRVEIAIRNAPGSVNVFIEDGPHGVLLIDAASDYPEARAALAEALSQVGRTLADVTNIVLTHVHIDHYGMAGWLAGEFGARVWMHEASSFELWRHWNPGPAGARFASFARQHGTEPGRAERIAGFDDWRALLTMPGSFRQVVDGQIEQWAGRRWRVIFTPGHASGHVCLWSDKDRVLVGGDQLLAKGHASVRWFSEELPDPLGAYLRGLRRLRELDPILLLAGHGPVIDDMESLATATERHHEALMDRLLCHLDQPRNAMELSRLVHGEMSDFRLRIVLTEIVAGLRHLEILGKVTSMLHQDVVHFGTIASSRRVWAWGPDLDPAMVPARAEQ